MSPAFLAGAVLVVAMPASSSSDCSLMDLRRFLVVAQALEAWMPEPPVTRRFREGDLADELRLEPHRVLALLARHLFEGRIAPFQRLECLGKAGEIARVEAGADLARIDELAIGERAEQERGERLTLHLRAAIAADHELIAFAAFDLEPVPGCARSGKARRRVSTRCPRALLRALARRTPALSLAHNRHRRGSWIRFSPTSAWRARARRSFSGLLAPVLAVKRKADRR